jgi:hypothetical protein
MGRSFSNESRTTFTAAAFLPVPRSGYKVRRMAAVVALLIDGANNSDLGKILTHWLCPT